MKTKSYLILLFLLGILFQTQAQLYTFRNYNHRDGLNIGSVNTIAQSEDGYLWIGAQGTPIIRFDGNNFKEMRAKNQHSDHHIAQMEYYNDSLFFASQYNGFYAFSPKTNSYHSFGINLNGLGDALAVINTPVCKYFISQKNFFTYKNGAIKQIKSSQKEQLEIYHYLVNKNQVLLFTNLGIFSMINGEIRPLHEVIGVPKSQLDAFKFGQIIRNKWMLCDETGSRWMELSTNSKGQLAGQRQFTTPLNLDIDEKIIEFSSSKDCLKSVAITNLGNVYTVVNNKLMLIAHNFSDVIEDPSSIFIDLNGDYWITSNLKGIYKVSLEPFTKIELSPIYESPEIMFPYQTRYNDIFISYFSGITKVGNHESTDFQEFPFVIRNVATHNNDYYVATNKGVKKYRKDGEKYHFDNVLFENENINLLIAERDYLWIGVSGKGLFRAHLRNMEPVQIFSENQGYTPNYYYTGQIGHNGKFIYFGTNTGIYYTSKDQPKLKRFNTDKNLGSYSGCSAKDVFGTAWFTMDHGLIGIDAAGKEHTVMADDYFSTHLFYTLCADRLGNLILGTNKGINILKVNRNGDIISNTKYDANSGFGGYETHMRSQFQNDNSIFVGTVEGLFLINTDILDQLKTPIQPILISLGEGEVDGAEFRNSYRFKLRVNNPKSGKIYYSYRLLGSQDTTWHNLKSNNLDLLNLAAGSYQLEVRATFDGQNFSPSAQYKFTVQSKVWESGWLIFFVILTIVGLNFLLIRYSKKLDRGSLIRTKDMEMHSKLVPMILLLGLFCATFAHIAAPALDSQLVLHLGPLLFLDFFLVGLYFLSRTVINTNRDFILNRILLVGIVMVLLHFFYELYLSGLHPFHITGIALTCLMLPFFVHGIRAMVTFTTVLLFSTIVLMIIVENPVYPRAYFALANCVLIVLLIFTSFLRANSLERLLFISGIINKGKIPAIAFNSTGKIIYVSENISRFIDSTHEQLINEDISTLNKYIPYEGKYRNVDVVKDFEAGKNYVVPMAKSDGTIHWIDWQYTEFSSDIKVILGQEISEKMELENTYKLLVQNAEDFIYRCDINGNFIFLNEASYERLGYSREDLLNKDSNLIVADDYQVEVRRFYADHFAERKNTSYMEFPILSKDGDIVWVGQHVTTIFAPGSNTHINGFIALARDITVWRRQQQLIQDQRDDITSSISYAQRIQLNLLPHERYFTSGFREHFIIYKPKDIVSGDFYWLETIGDTTVFALGDCTGHGVPGAFMTLLGINLLNSVVKENRILDPGKILDEMDKKLVDILPRNPNQNSLNDGMEITICAVNETTDQLAFACAGSRFLVYHDESFTMLKGDNKHIGDRPPQDFVNYSTHYTPFTSEHLLYLFTDGLQDQFGGKLDKKFSFRRVLTMLERNADLPLPDQRKNIEKRLDGWIGTGDQTDDITILSIKKKIT